jgi:hypothetical protein
MTSKEHQEPKSIDDYRQRVADYMSEKDKEKLEKHKNRFFKKVNKNGEMFLSDSITFPEIIGTHCWEWTGAIDVNGYGIFDNPKHSRLAHRESYFLHNDGLAEDVPRHRAVYRIIEVDVSTGKVKDSKPVEMTLDDIKTKFGVTKRAVSIAVEKTQKNGYVKNTPGKMKTVFHGYRVKPIGTKLLTHKTKTKKVLDHKCRNRKCVNPHHLSLTTQKNNMKHMRKEGRANDFGGKSNRQGLPRAATCPSGHDRENMRNWPNGNEYCKLCNDRDNSRRVKKHRDLKKIAQLSVSQPPPGPPRR